MVGIYMIENKINGKRYIGQSWNIEQRFYSHKYKTHNRYLESSIKKNGISNFDFRVLYELKEFERTQERLNDLEEAYIDILDTCNPTKGYNLTGGGSRGLNSEETIEKIRQSKLGSNNPWFEKHQSAEHVAKRTAKLRGIKRSQEVIAKNRNGHLGKRNRRESIEKGAAKHQKAVLCIETNQMFESIKKASIETGIHVVGIGMVCRGKNKTTKGFHFKFV